MWDPVMILKMPVFSQKDCYMECAIDVMSNSPPTLKQLGTVKKREYSSKVA